MKNKGGNFHFLDLFAGCGGFSLGLEAAGFDGLGSVEIDPPTRRTLLHNFGPSPVRSVRESDGDIRKLDPSDVKRDLRALGISDLDLLVACPPCQGFSRIGRGKLDSLKGERGAFHSDPRNSLYKKAISFLQTLKPKVFLLENVPGMIFMRGRNIAERVCLDTEAAGYSVRCALLNASWYGVPQLRERLIILGFRNDLETIPEFPAIAYFGKWLEGHTSVSDSPADYWSRKDFFVPFSKLPKVKSPKALVTVGDAFADLPRFTAHLKALTSGTKYKSIRSAFPPTGYKSSSPPNDYCRLMRKWGELRSDSVSDHFCRWTPRDFETFARMVSGDRYNEACDIAEARYREAYKEYERGKRKRPRKEEFIPPYRKDSFEEKWRKLYRNRPSWTVTAHLSQDTYSHIHYDSGQGRALTIREAARLQSFPDAFRVEGNTGDAFRQIGNAVPPLLAHALGLQILRKMILLQETRKKRSDVRPYLPRQVAVTRSERPSLQLDLT